MSPGHDGVDHGGIDHDGVDDEYADLEHDHGSDGHQDHVILAS